MVRVRPVKSRNLKSPTLRFIKPNGRKQVVLTKNRAATLHPFQIPAELQQRWGCVPGWGLYHRVSLTLPAQKENNNLNLTNSKITEEQINSKGAD